MARIDHTCLDPRYTDIFRGLAWCCAVCDEPRLTDALGNALKSCYQSIPGIGPRDTKVGNACLFALAYRGKPDDIACVSRARKGVKQPSLRKQIDKTLNEAAAMAGVSRHDLEDMVVPTFDMRQIGQLEAQFGQVVAHCALSQDGSATWHDGGKPRKVPPQSVRRDHAASLKAFQRQVKDAQQTLAVQRWRLERAWLDRRQWRYGPVEDAVDRSPAAGCAHATVDLDVRL